MAPRFRCLGWLVPLAVAVVLAVGGRQAPAQTLNEGFDRLDNEYRKVKGRWGDFLKGTRVNPEDQSEVRVIDLRAKIHTYGVYLQNLETKPPREGIARAYVDFEHEVDALLNPKDRQALQSLAEVYREKIRIHALEVLEFNQARPIHKLFNARVLAKVAELGQPALADTLIKVLKDPKQTDAVRFYVLRGMSTLLVQVQPGEMTPVLSKDERARCATALVEFLEQRKGPDKHATTEEIEGIRWLRREAVRALAQIHVPTVSDKVRPALVLARFAGNDGRIQPPTRIDERVEAAIGLARMQSSEDKRYQPEYAAGQIAKCLGAFAQMYNSELPNTKNAKDKQTRPWRVDAALLKDALAAMKTSNEKNTFVVQIVDRGTLLLDKVIRGSDIDANELAWWSSPESDGPSKELFQGVADSVVKPAAPESDKEK
jgi:hypothetical protein